MSSCESDNKNRNGSFESLQVYCNEFGIGGGDDAVVDSRSVK